MGGKQLAKRLLLLLLVNMKNQRVAPKAATHWVWDSHKPNIGHSLKHIYDEGERAQPNH